MTDERYYSPDDLADLSKDDLETIADARGLSVEGSGKDGGILVSDLEAAISADQDARGVNPAIAPTPPDAVEPAERTYKVTGPQPVLDHKPGATFTATIPAEQEAFLIEVGHLQTVNLEEQE